MNRYSPLILTLFLSLFLAAPAAAGIVVDEADPVFAARVQKELETMRSGKRGEVSRQLVQRLDVATASTTIRPITADESTWHPNDTRGIRSHTQPQDTLVRGAARSRPTGAIVFVHPGRVDPTMSVFKLGTFVHELSLAADLNEGVFSHDFKVREKRASFYRNAWLDSQGLKPVQVSDRVPTPEYSQAKAAGLLTEANSAQFPILHTEAVPPLTPSPVPPVPPSEQ